MINIKVANSDEAETILNVNGIISTFVDDDEISVHADDYLDVLDILADEFQLEEIVNLAKQQPIRTTL